MTLSFIVYLRYMAAKGFIRVVVSCGDPDSDFFLTPPDFVSVSSQVFCVLIIVKPLATAGHVRKRLTER